MKRLLMLPVFLVLMIPSIIIQGSESTTIESIVGNPGPFHFSSVDFEGIVQRYQRGYAASTSFYVIRGDYGAEIRVNTRREPPQIYSRYRVTGTVIIEDRVPLIIETGRDIVNGRPVLTVVAEPEGGGEILPAQRFDLNPGDTVELHARSNRNYGFRQWTIGENIISTQENLVFEMPSSNTTIIAHFNRGFPLIPVIIIALIVIIVVIIVLSLRLRRKPIDEPYDKQEPKPGTEKKHPDSTEKYDTIKFSPSVPKTMRFIPGKLEVLNGPDKGKALMLAGYHTPEGSIASIGRDYQDWESHSALQGDRKFAHIRIRDESRTLSRMQAEFIYRDGKLYLKNLGSINPSQVDGNNVQVNELAEIKDGSKIQAGYIEFCYHQ